MTPIKAVAIGASLGGPQAIRYILSKLPGNFPVPILIVQHISHGFAQGMVDWVQKTTELTVQLAKQSQQALPGNVYIAPDHCQMCITKHQRIHLDYNNKKHQLQPSVGELFRSVADHCGADCVGILLTGMGKDGANELGYMKERGAMTIAQNEESSVVFGMPGEAIKLGAVKKILPLEEIPNELVKLNFKNSELRR